MIYIPVGDEQRFVAKMAKSHTESAAGSEKDLFLLNYHSGNTVQDSYDLLPQMMAVHHDSIEAEILQTFYSQEKEGLVKDGKKRFGAHKGMGQQPGTKSGCQNHCLHSTSSSKVEIILKSQQ
jgi:hypothetical protein